MKPLPILIAVAILCAAIGVISWMSQPRSSAVAVSGSAQVSENPFEIPENGPYPKAVLDEEAYDFGKMILGETDHHAFVIRNEGEAPLTLRKGFITCKCTVPTIPEGGIAPGESAQVVMEWKPLATTESFDKFAEIWTNDPEHEIVRLTITGEVRDLVQVQPPSPWTISSLKEKEPTTLKGGIASGRDAFEIVALESSADWLQVEQRPMEASELEEIGEGMAAGYMLSGTILPEMPVGRFHEKITVKTNLENDHTLEIIVNGTRPGPFSIIGQSWYGKEMTVRLGEVAASKGKSVTLSLFTARQDQPLMLTSVESDPDVAQVSLKRDESFPAKAKEKYDLTFTLPPGIPPGRYSDQDRINVRLTTNRDAMAEINLSIDALVE